MAAIGIISASQWITYHGLAMKVTSDSSPFSWIVPCGTQDHQVRSIKRLLEKNKSSNGFKETDSDPPDDCKLIDITHDSVIMEFSEVFQLEVLKKHILVRDFRYKLLVRD